MDKERRFGNANLTKREISDKVMAIVAIEGSFPKIYEEGNRKIEFCVSDIEPVIYGYGIAEPNIFASVKVYKNNKDNFPISFRKRVELGAYVDRKLARKNIPYGEKYFDDTNAKVTEILMKVMNSE